MAIKDLFNARLRIQTLEADAEKPRNFHRWRTLEVRFKDRDRSQEFSLEMTVSRLVKWIQSINQSSFISGMTERKPAIHKSNTHIAIVQELRA